MANKGRAGKAIDLPAGDLSGEAAEAFRLLREAMLPSCEQPEPGYFTAKQWSEMWGCSSRRCESILTEGVRRNAVEFKMYRIKVGAGQMVRPVRHYKVKLTTLRQHK